MVEESGEEIRKNTSSSIIFILLSLPIYNYKHIWSTVHYIVEKHIEYIKFLDLLMTMPMTTFFQVSEECFSFCFSILLLFENVCIKITHFQFKTFKQLRLPLIFSGKQICSIFLFLKRQICSIYIYYLYFQCQ